MRTRLARAARRLGWLVLAAPGFVPGTGLAARSPSAPTQPTAHARAPLRVHRYDARLDALVAPDVRAEVVAEGHGLGGGCGRRPQRRAERSWR